MYQRWLEKLARYRTREKEIRLCSDFSRWGWISTALLAGVMVLQGLISFSSGTRGVILILFFAILIALFVRLAGRALWLRLFQPNQPTLNQMALQVGWRHPHLKDRLANALQLAALAESQKNFTSQNLIDCAMEAVAAEAEKYDFTADIDRKPLRQELRRLLLLLAGVALAVILFPHFFSQGMTRTFFPFSKQAAAAENAIWVLPGHCTMVRGENLSIQAGISGQTRAALTLEVARHGRTERFEMQRTAGDTFRYTLPSLKDSLTYAVWHQAQRSASFHARVFDLPLLRHLQVRVIAPLYSGLAAKELEANRGDITALRGSRIEWNASANKAIQSGQLCFGKGKVLPLEVAGPSLQTAFTLLSDDTYHYELVDQENLHSTNPILFHLRAISDQAPYVRILSPGKDIDLSEDMRLPLVIQAQDDFGIAGLFIVYQVLANAEMAIDSTRYARQEIILPGPHREQRTVAFEWDLSHSPLLPEEVLVYYAEVRDNDAVSGPQTGRSEIFRARFPSIYELFEEVTQSQDQSIAALENTLEKSYALKKQIEDLAREMQRADDVNWQKKQKIDETLKQESEIKSTLEEISRRLDEMVEQMEAHRLLSPETLRKYEELQQLFNEIMTPELQKTMDKVAEAMQQLDPNLLQKALQELKTSDESLQKSLERTISLLKKLKLEQQVDQAIKMLQDMEMQQERIAEQAQQKDAAACERLAQEQNALRQKLNRVEETLEQLQKEMNQEPGMPQEEIANAQRELDKAAVAEQMQAMEEALAQQRGDKMQTAAAHVQSGLQQARQQLQTAKDMMNGAMQQRAMRALQQGMKNLLTLSQMQEKLMRETVALPAASAQIPEAAEKQQQLHSSLGRVMNDMFEASKTSFGISPRIGSTLGQTHQSMRNALQNFENRALDAAGQQQGKAMTGLNEAVLQIDAAMQGMMKGGGGGMSMEQFMQQMQGLANGQQGVNAQTMGMMGSGQQMSLAQQAAFSRLAAQQGQIRKSLEQLAAEASGLAEILGDLDQMATDMKQVEKDLLGHAVNRPTIERQNRILSRMLDTQRSVREREYSKKRKAETGKEYAGVNPEELPDDFGETKARLQQDLLRAKKEGYSRDYLELIRKYFEALSEREQPTAPAR